MASIAEFLSSGQIDLLSNKERKSVVNTLLSKVSVFLGGETKWHHLGVEFSEEVSDLLGALSNHPEENTAKSLGAVLGGSLPSKAVW
jgi:hypothetical protein